MKKTLIAICIAATPLASQAATVYQNDETSVGIGGEFDVYLNQNNHSSNPNADFDVDVWAKIQADINHKINKDVSVFASAEFESGTYYGSSNDHDLSNSDQTVRTDDVYVGATFFDSLGVAFGEIGDFGDSLDAITIDNTNEGYGYMDDFNQSIESKGHAASIKYSQNNLELIADTYLSDDPMLDTAYGVSATYLLESNVGDFGIGLSYQDRGNRVEWDRASVGDNSTMGMMASYQVSGFNIAMNYAQEEVDGVDRDAMGVATSYTYQKARAYFTYGQAEEDFNNNDLSYYTVGAEYYLSNDILTFIEYSEVENRDFTLSDEDMMMLGMYYTF